MGDIFKLFFLLLVILFIINNSKADKTAIDEEIALASNFNGGAEYNFILPEEEKTYK